MLGADEEMEEESEEPTNGRKEQKVADDSGRVRRKVIFSKDIEVDSEPEDDDDDNDDGILNPYFINNGNTLILIIHWFGT